MYPSLLAQHPELAIVMAAGDRQWLTTQGYRVLSQEANFWITKQLADAGPAGMLELRLHRAQREAVHPRRP